MTAFDWNAITSETGPIFGAECEDLDFTLLQWHKGQGVAEHINTEVDVLMIVFSGSGEVVLDGLTLEMTAGQALLMPKNAKRAIRSLSHGFRYLNIHKRRRRLVPGSPRDRR